MLTQTSEIGLQVLAYLAMRNSKEPIPPKALADILDASPSYMAKITGSLVKAGILHATRGAQGGVTLSNRPEQITLLDVVEACQGKVLGDFCGGVAPLQMTCAYHQAMAALHQAIVETLKRWTVADLAKRPTPDHVLRGKVDCKMGRIALLADETVMQEEMREKS